MRRYRNNLYDYDADDYYCYQAVAAPAADDDNDDDNSYFYYLGLLLSISGTACLILTPLLPQPCKFPG